MMCVGLGLGVGGGLGLGLDQSYDISFGRGRCYQRECLYDIAVELVVRTLGWSLPLFVFY